MRLWVRGGETPGWCSVRARPHSSLSVGVAVAVLTSATSDEMGRSLRMAPLPRGEMAQLGSTTGAFTRDGCLGRGRGR